MELAIAGVLGQAVTLAALVLLRCGGSHGVQAVRLRSDGRRDASRRPLRWLPPTWAVSAGLAIFATATVAALVGAARL